MMTTETTDSVLGRTEPLEPTDEVEVEDDKAVEAATEPEESDDEDSEDDEADSEGGGGAEFVELAEVDDAEELVARYERRRLEDHLLAETGLEPMGRSARLLETKLTDAEKAKRSQELAEMIGKQESLEAEKKDVVSGFNARIKALDEEIKTMAGPLRKGTDELLVECTALADFGQNQVVVFRLDTGAEVERRAMSAAEREAMAQGKLPFEAQAPAATEPEGEDETSDEESSHKGRRDADGRPLPFPGEHRVSRQVEPQRTGRDRITASDVRESTLFEHDGDEGLAALTDGDYYRFRLGDTGQKFFFIPADDYPEATEQDDTDEDPQPVLRKGGATA